MRATLRQTPVFRTGNRGSVVFACWHDFRRWDLLRKSVLDGASNRCWTNRRVPCIRVPMDLRNRRFPNRDVLITVDSGLTVQKWSVRRFLSFRKREILLLRLDGARCRCFVGCSASWDLQVKEKNRGNRSLRCKRSTLQQLVSVFFSIFFFLFLIKRGDVDVYSTKVSICDAHLEDSKLLVVVPCTYLARSLTSCAAMSATHFENI